MIKDWGESIIMGKIAFFDVNSISVELAELSVIITLCTVYSVQIIFNYIENLIGYTSAHIPSQWDKHSLTHTCMHSHKITHTYTITHTHTLPHNKKMKHKNIPV